MLSGREGLVVLTSPFVNKVINRFISVCFVLFSLISIYFLGYRSSQTLRLSLIFTTHSRCISFC